MVASRRTFACIVTLTAMLSPSASVAWTVVHLALDRHHHGAAGDAHGDAEAALHGHRHDAGTPDHGHEATAAAPNPLPLPGSTLHPSMNGFTPAAAADVDRLVGTEPFPPQRVPIILRI